MKHLSVDSIQIHLHLAEVFLAPRLAGVEKAKKMIMKRSGKS